jgi:hypothetical protein
MPTGIVPAGWLRSIFQLQCWWSLAPTTGVPHRPNKLACRPKDHLFPPGRVIVIGDDVSELWRASALGVGCSLARCGVGGAFVNVPKNGCLLLLMEHWRGCVDCPNGVRTVLNGHDDCESL